MKLIKTFTYNDIIDLIFEAKNHLFISLPSIDEEIADALIKSGNLSITNIVIDNSEEVIRNGYGEESGIEKLRNVVQIIKPKDENFWSANSDLLMKIIDEGIKLIEQGYYRYEIWSKGLLMSFDYLKDQLEPSLMDIWESSTEEGDTLKEFAEKLKKENPKDEIQEDETNKKIVKSSVHKPTVIEISDTLATRFQIFQCEGNLISFIISDDKGYFLFPQSKIFTENSSGPNSFMIDPITIQILKTNYFPSKKPINNVYVTKKETITESIKHFEQVLEDVKENDILVSINPFDDKKFEEIQKKLKINPPLSPNLQRKINTYTAKIQFVELKFSGGNLENRIVQLPKKAIPINSEELKSLLFTRIKMFQDVRNNTDYKIFQDFKDKIEKVRKDFLTPITCRPGKSIIKMENKESFILELEKLKTEAKKMNMVLTTMLEEEKLNTIDLLRKELVTFFNLNEPKEVKEINKPDIKERKVKEIINTIIGSVKFPEVTSLINGISLNELFYDLTWNDFRDEKLHKEFLEKKIMNKDEIDMIVEMKIVFDVKK